MKTKVINKEGEGFLTMEILRHQGEGTSFIKIPPQHLSSNKNVN